jgi:plasmid stability protein
MPSLQVRELPQHIYETLCQEAEAEHRSITQQAVAALARGLSMEIAPQIRRKAVMESIREETVQYAATLLPDPAVLMREDRDR